MFQWIKRLVQPPEPAGPPQTIRHFEPAEGTITKGVVEPSGDGWLVEVGEGQTIALFEVEKPGVEQCMLTYRAEMKSQPSIESLTPLPPRREATGRYKACVCWCIL